MNRFLIAILTILPLLTSAQSDIQMADNFRGEGKIYVVIFVILLILAGIFYYLFRLEKKVRVLEKRESEKQQ